MLLSLCVSLLPFSASVHPSLGDRGEMQLFWEEIKKTDDEIFAEVHLTAFGGPCALQKQLNEPKMLKMESLDSLTS